MTREIENGKVAFEGGQCAGRMDHHGQRGPRNSATQERHERWAVLPLFVCTLSIESTGNTPAVYWKLARFAGPFRKRRGWRLAAHQSGTARCVFVVVRHDPANRRHPSRQSCKGCTVLCRDGVTWTLDVVTGSSV